jgi:hypothetical protein
MQTFDGCRAKIGDIQLELTEEFMSKAIGLPSKGERWFKNTRIEGSLMESIYDIPKDQLLCKRYSYLPGKT